MLATIIMGNIFTRKKIVIINYDYFKKLTRKVIGILSTIVIFVSAIISYALYSSFTLLNDTPEVKLLAGCISTVIIMTYSNLLIRKILDNIILKLIMEYDLKINLKDIVNDIYSMVTKVYNILFSFTMFMCVSYSALKDVNYILYNNRIHRIFIVVAILIFVVRLILYIYVTEYVSKNTKDVYTTDLYLVEDLSQCIKLDNSEITLSTTDYTFPIAENKFYILNIKSKKAHLHNLIDREIV